MFDLYYNADVYLVYVLKIHKYRDNCVTFWWQNRVVRLHINVCNQHPEELMMLHCTALHMMIREMHKEGLGIQKEWIMMLYVFSYDVMMKYWWWRCNEVLNNEALWCTELWCSMMLYDAMWCYVMLQMWRCVEPWCLMKLWNLKLLT